LGRQGVSAAGHRFPSRCAIPALSLAACAPPGASSSRAGAVSVSTRKLFPGRSGDGTHVGNDTRAKAYVNRRLTWARMGNYENAKADFDTAIELDRRDPNAYDGRAFVFSKMGRNDEHKERSSKSLRTQVRKVVVPRVVQCNRKAARPSKQDPHKRRSWRACSEVFCGPVVSFHEVKSR